MRHGPILQPLPIVSQDGDDRDSFRIERPRAPRAANMVCDKFGRPMPPLIPYAIVNNRT